MAAMKGTHVFDESIELRPIGFVESSLADPASAPKQDHEGAPQACLVIDEGVRAGLEGIQPGDHLVVLTWLDRGRRDVLRVHPRGDPANVIQGVFNTRSPDRPNPIGLHAVVVVGLHGARVTVAALDAVDGTPIIDIKPVLTNGPRPTHT